MHEIKNVTITYEYNYKYNPEGYLKALIDLSDRANRF